MSNLQPSVTPSSVIPSTLRGSAAGEHGPRHPDDVLADSALTTDRKREILAGWASDDRAVRDAPSLRQLDDGAVVPVDEILGALRTLDRAGAERPPVSPPTRSDRRRRPVRARLRILVGRRDDDDDDPPPSPAAAFPLEVALARRRRWEQCGGREAAVA